MQNPQSTPKITANTHYSYLIHKNIPWNITEYKVPSIHFDQKEIAKQRYYNQQKKGIKDQLYHTTKRGFYMDYHVKHAAMKPSPNHYIKHQPWTGDDVELTSDQVAKVRASIKYSYLDRIQMQQNNRPKPGISTYHLNKSMQDLQAQKQKLKTKKIQHGQKRFFFQDIQHLSALTPGSGHYNPRLSMPLIKPTKKTPQSQASKHLKLSVLQTSRDLIKPNPATYSPTSAQYKTFQKTFSLSKKDKLIKNGFGSDARFIYTRKDMKMIKEQRPAPWKYQTKIQWKGKQISPKKKLWNQIICKASPPKVYH